MSAVDQVYAGSWFGRRFDELGGSVGGSGLNLADLIGLIRDEHIAANAGISQTKLLLTSDGPADTPSLRRLGTDAGQAAPGDHTHEEFVDLGSMTGTVVIPTQPNSLAITATGILVSNPVVVLEPPRPGIMLVTQFQQDGVGGHRPTFPQAPGSNPPFALGAGEVTLTAWLTGFGGQALFPVASKTAAPSSVSERIGVFQQGT